MPANTISVARPSKWGNPIEVAEAFESEGVKVAAVTPADAVELYRQWLTAALVHTCTREGLAELRGKNLACWCPLDQPCHVDVLLDLANGPICEAVA